MGLTGCGVLNAKAQLGSDLSLAVRCLACLSLILTTVQGFWRASLEQKIANAFNLKLMEKSAELN